mgnify:FL=1
MEHMTNLLKQLSSRNTGMSSDEIEKFISAAKKRVSNMTPEEYAQTKIDAFNSQTGKLEGYDCPICKNKGEIMFLKNGYETIRECQCMNVRKTIKRIERSGLKDLMKDYTFEKFIVSSDWQKKAKTMALEFLKDYENKWFFVGGQVGCGKTHLCTALVGAFIRSGKPAHYMLWRDEVVQLKAVVTDDEAYGKAIRKLKEIEVLYIDDFFKTERGKQPSTAEINIAFELLNYRYNNPRLVTIISSERLIDDIIDIDEAVGSRIYQRSKQYCMIVNYDRSKNYRLNGGGNSG